jgi:hypothetical protein
MPKWNSTNTTAQSNFFQLQQLTKHMTPMGHVLKSFQCSCYRFVPFCRFFPATPIKASQRIEHVFDQVAICPANFRLFEPYQVIYRVFRHNLHFEQNQQTTDPQMSTAAQRI